MDAKQLLDINPVLIDRVRLVIMATLSAAKDAVDFTTLLETLELTKGNLSAHLRKLEDAGLVQVTKEFVDRKPRTTYSCTKQGKKEMIKYLNGVEALLGAGSRK